MADDESSELSSLSSLSPAPSEDEGDVELKKDKGILKFFHKLPKGAKPAAPEREPSPPAPKRPASPPHDYVLADNPDIAVCEIWDSARKTRNVASDYEVFWGRGKLTRGHLARTLFVRVCVRLLFI